MRLMEWECDLWNGNETCMHLRQLLHEVGGTLPAHTVQTQHRPVVLLDGKKRDG